MTEEERGGLEREVAEAEQAVADSVRCGPARFDLPLEQRQEWAARHRDLMAWRATCRARAAGGGR